MVSAGLCKFQLKVKLVIDNLLKENNLLGSLRSFVSIALTIAHQTLKYVFVLIVCQNSTNTLRLLCTSRFQFARKLLHHQRNSTLKGKWTFSYFIFFYHECLVRILMRPSFAGSFSLIFHRFHLLNAKKKRNFKEVFPFTVMIFQTG